jgi:hypothetical protein
MALVPGPLVRAPTGAGPGSVTQNVATTAGATYTLGWHMAGNPEGPPAIKIMNVYWNGSPYGQPRTS